MRIPSGVTDQYAYFVAVDATDFTTRETGLASFTVYRSRNGGAAVAMTTPTINETDATNMPGVYELLLDEDTTLDAGDYEQEMVLHITHAGMAPVTVKVTLFRPVTDVYQAKVDVVDDDGGTADRYTVCWFKNAEPFTTGGGITSPQIQVIKIADGTDLVAATAMTEIGTTELYRYVEATNRMVDGVGYVAKVTATIDGATRTWYQPVGRDS